MTNIGVLCCPLRNLFTFLNQNHFYFWRPAIFFYILFKTFSLFYLRPLPFNILIFITS